VEKTKSEGEWVVAEPKDVAEGHGDEDEEKQ
jgi:hypothetical protein